MQGPHDSGSKQGEAIFKAPSFWSSAVFGTILSLAVTGYAFPENNNVFHLPIVGELYNRPEFANDPFIQSLRYYSSGVWLILAGSSQWIDPRITFFVLLTVSRAISLVGFLLCADYFGISDAKARHIFAGLIATTALLQLDSYAGDGGLFVRNFTHSEICNGLFLISIWSVLRGRFTLALAMIGPTFFVNAFFGVWLAFVLLFVIANEIASRRRKISQLAISASIGGAIGVPFAIPVLINIVRNPDFRIPIDFDFKEYILNYYYQHILFAPINIAEKIDLALIVVTCMLALASLHDPLRRLAATLGACVCLYAIGIVASYVTSSRLLLNLHMLRSSTLIQELAALLTCSVFVHWLLGENRARTMLAACGVVGMAVYPWGILRYGFPIGLVAIFAADALVERQKATRFIAGFLPQRGVIEFMTLTILALLAAVAAYANHFYISRDAELRSDWDKIANWARSETDQGSIFLVPVFSTIKKYPGRDMERYVSGLNTSFEYESSRSLWVDFKRGAYIMWSPSSYHRWLARTQQVEQLRGHDEMADYAIKNHIPYFIEFASGKCLEGAAFRTRTLCVFRTKAD